jgi:putative GTP pyrophosphokinase
MMMYNGAMREVKTKLEVLNDEFQIRSQTNPIEFIKCRIKEPKSIIDKLKRKGLDITLDNMLEHINDIAGIRVVCSFIEDIYEITDMLIRQDDITLINMKDYIKNPKENGYRSLHLVVGIPVFFSNKKQQMRVEVQIRTIAMDFWASLEHQIRYKKYENVPEGIIQDLKGCADIISVTDSKMQDIQKQLLEYVKKS